MNPFSYLKSLFAALDWTSDLPKPEDVVIPPAPPKPEPSCFARGVVKLWEKGEGWKVSKRQLIKGTSYHGDYSYWDVMLNHQQSGVQIRLSEYGFFPSIGLDTVKINEEVKIQGSNYHVPDGELVKTSILANPYPALKKRLDKQTKNNATRAAKVEALEKLGCPVSEPVIKVLKEGPIKLI